MKNEIQNSAVLLHTLPNFFSPQVFFLIPFLILGIITTATCSSLRGTSQAKQGEATERDPRWPPASETAVLLQALLYLYLENVACTTPAKENTYKR